MCISRMSTMRHLLISNFICIRQLLEQKMSGEINKINIIKVFVFTMLILKLMNYSNYSKGLCRYKVKKERKKRKITQIPAGGSA